MTLKLFFLFSLSILNCFIYSETMNAYARQANMRFEFDSHLTIQEVFQQCRKKGICIGPKNSLTLTFKDVKIEEGSEDAQEISIYQLFDAKSIIFLSESQKDIWVENPLGKINQVEQIKTPRDVIRQAQRENPDRKYILLMHHAKIYYEDASAGIKFENLRPSPHTTITNPMRLIEID